MNDDDCEVVLEMIQDFSNRAKQYSLRVDKFHKLAQEAKRRNDGNGFRKFSRKASESLKRAGHWFKYARIVRNMVMHNSRQGAKSHV